MNVYLIAATILAGAMLPCLLVILRGAIFEAVVALELCGALTTLALICLAEGFQRSTYFGVALVAAVATWIGGLIYVRFLARLH